MLLQKRVNWRMKTEEEGKRGRMCSRTLLLQCVVLGRLLKHDGTLAGQLATRMSQHDWGFLRCYPFTLSSSVYPSFIKTMSVSPVQWEDRIEGWKDNMLSESVCHQAY